MAACRGPELEFPPAKWAAHLSFSTVAELLQDVLPVDIGLHQETIRRHGLRLPSPDPSPALTGRTIYLILTVQA